MSHDLVTNSPINPIHPGEVLRNDFLNELGITAAQLAANLDISPHELDAILRGDRDINADLEAHLAKCFGTTPDFWLNLRRDYDRRVSQSLKQRSSEEN